MIPISRQNSILIINGLFCVSILLFRINITMELNYIFLLWNLFLASIPYGMTQILNNSRTLQNNRVLLMPYLGLWLLFLPNAPYIITDLIHLNSLSGRLLWYDCFLIYLFASNGFILGILSIIDVYNLIVSKYNIIIARIGVFTTALLCGYGVYLGRYLRWNSWELFLNPNGLLTDVIVSLKHPKAITLSILIGSLVFIAVLSFQYYFNKKREQ